MPDIMPREVVARSRGARGARVLGRGDVGVLAAPSAAGYG